MSPCLKFKICPHAAKIYFVTRGHFLKKVYSLLNSNFLSGSSPGLHHCQGLPGIGHFLGLLGKTAKPENLVSESTSDSELIKWSDLDTFLFPVPGGLTVPSLAVLINANEVTAVKCSFLLCRCDTEHSLMVCLIRIIAASRHHAFCARRTPPDWKLWKL